MPVARPCRRWLPRVPHLMRLRLPPSRSTAWVLVESAASALLSLVSMLVIGRVIGPEQAGIGALAVTAFLLLDVVGAALFPDALVQRQHLTGRHARSALTAAVLVGLACAALLAGSAPSLGFLTGQPAILPLVLVLAPLLPLSAYSGAAAGLATRDQRFRLLAGRVLLAQPLALLAGLSAAAGGLGAWAMVINQAAATMLVFALLLGIGRMPLRPALDKAALRDLWPVAGPQIAALALMLGRYRIFLLALGALVAEAVLAHAHFAFRLLDAALSMTWQATTRIALPRLCALQHDRDALARCYGETAQLQALLGLPVSVGVALVAHDLVLGLLGPAWDGTAEAARVAGLGAAFTFLHGNHFSLFLALGRPGWNLRVAVAELAVPLLALALMRPTTAEAAALAWAVQHAVVVPVAASLVLRELRRSPLWLLRHAVPALLGLAAMVPAVLLVQGAMAEAAPLPRLLAAAAAGAIAYAAAAWLALGRRRPAALATWHRASAERA